MYNIACLPAGWEVYDPNKDYGKYTIHDRKK